MAELRSLLAPGEAVDLYAISKDAPEDSAKLAERIAKDGKGEVHYRFLSDPGSKTIDAWGLRNPHLAGQALDGVPYPAAYVIDKSGKVAWSRFDEDYRVRPPNSEIRAALEALK